MTRTLTCAVLLVAVAASCKKAPPAAPAPAARVLHIAALNDFHGALYEMPKYQQPDRALGGLPWLAAAVGSLRAEHPDLLLLDGGDIFQGSWPVNATQGRGAVEAYNLLGVDAAAVGNHEFDYGGLPGEHPLRGALEVGGRLAEYAWLAANIHEEQGPWAPEGFAPWTLIERGGVTVGVLGLSTVDTPQTTLIANVIDLRFEDVVEATRRTAPLLREAGADVVIAVGHLTGKCEPVAYDAMGDAPCTPGGEVGRLLTELPAGTLDVLIAGHAHTLLHHRVGDTFVLEQRASGHAIGRLDLVVGPDGVDLDASTLHEPWFLEHDPVDPGCTGAPFPTEPIDVGGRVLTPDAEALALIERLEAEAGSLCDEVGCTTAEMGRDRGRGTALGALVADAMLAAMPDAQVALTNAGGLRANLPAGTIRREHLQAVMPFDNRLLRVEMTGEQLLRTLRIGSSGAHGVLQVAGMTYGFDPAGSAGDDLDGDGAVDTWEQDRLCRDAVTVGGAAIDPTATYQVVTTDFLYGGGDHLGPAFAGIDVAAEGPLLREALNTWFEEQPACVEPDLAARVRVAACAD